MLQIHVNTLPQISAANVHSHPPRAQGTQQVSAGSYKKRRQTIQQVNSQKGRREMHSLLARLSEAEILQAVSSLQ